MKQINEYRRAAHFNLTGTDVARLVAIVNWLKGRKQSLIAVVPTEGRDDLHFYTVRVSDNRVDGGIYDYELNTSAWNNVPEILATHTILEAK